MSGDQPAPARRIFPFARLPSVPAGLGRMLLGLWSLLLVATIIFSCFDSWRQWHLSNNVARPLAQVGLFESEGDYAGVYVDTYSVEVMTAGMPGLSQIAAINGVAIPEDATVEVIAAALDGPPGKVKVRFVDDEWVTYEAELRRGPDVLADNGDVTLQGWPLVLLIVVQAIPVIALIWCSALLLFRRGNETVAVLLSFAFLSYAFSFGGMLAYEWLELQPLADVSAFIALLLVASVLPAFPDGRYRSTIGALYGPIMSLFVLIVSWVDEAGTGYLLAVPVLIGASLFPLLHFRRTPAGVERQQLKWAGVGFSGALIIGISALASFAAFEQSLPDRYYDLAANGGHLIFMLSMAAAPVGVTIGLLQFRLWDADRAIGRSAAVATLTTALAAVWTVVAHLTNELLGSFVGADNKAVIAGGSALVAAAVINPLRGHVNGWVDKRFQYGVLALQAIPDQMRQWQLSDTPEEAGERVLNVLVGKLKANATALAVHENGTYRLVALHQAEQDQDEPLVSEADIAAWLEQFGEPGNTIDPVCFNDPLFAYRLPLRDRNHTVGLLMVARRPGGVGFASDEIKALRGIATPLAAALRLALRREQRDRRLEQALKATG